MAAAVLGRLLRARVFAPGDFFLHREHGYRGVVVLQAAAVAGHGREWLRKQGALSDVNVPESDFCVALIDERDRKMPSFYYVHEVNMVPYLSEQPLQHPLVAKYFSALENGAYVPIVKALPARQPTV